MQWFRMYAEAIDDGKLRILAYEDRWHFVALLCLKAQGTLDVKDGELRMRQMSVKFGMSPEELKKTMKRLVTVGLVSEAWQPVNWNKRQFVSDSSTPRVQAFRKRSRNVSETDQNQNRTDTEHIQRRETRESAAPLAAGQGAAATPLPKPDPAPRRRPPEPPQPRALKEVLAAQEKSPEGREATFEAEFAKRFGSKPDV